MDVLDFRALLARHIPEPLFDIYIALHWLDVNKIYCDADRDYLTLIGANMFYFDEADLLFVKTTAQLFYEMGRMPTIRDMCNRINRTSLLLGSFIDDIVQRLSKVQTYSQLKQFSWWVAASGDYGMLWICIQIATLLGYGKDRLAYTELRYMAVALDDIKSTSNFQQLLGIFFVAYATACEKQMITHKRADYEDINLIDNIMNLLLVPGKELPRPQSDDDFMTWITE